MTPEDIRKFREDPFADFDPLLATYYGMDDVPHFVNGICRRARILLSNFDRDRVKLLSVDIDYMEIKGRDAAYIQQQEESSSIGEAFLFITELWRIRACIENPSLVDIRLVDNSTPAELLATFALMQVGHFFTLIEQCKDQAGQFELGSQAADWLMDAREAVALAEGMAIEKARVANRAKNATDERWKAFPPIKQIARELYLSIATEKLSNLKAGEQIFDALPDRMKLTFKSYCAPDYDPDQAVNTISRWVAKFKKDCP